MSDRERIHLLELQQAEFAGSLLKMKKQRDEARADYATALEAAKAYKEEWIQARADVLNLRSIVRQTQYKLDHHKRQSCNCNGCTTLADTAHYEQYR